MTHPVAVELQDHETVEELPGVESAVPLFAVIQHSYEEARARIHDLADSSWPAADGSDQHPGTELIDMRLVAPPAVLGAATPSTATMSSAARLLAEQASGEGAGLGGGERTGAADGVALPGAGASEARARPFSAELRAAKAMVATIMSRWLPESAAISPFATSGDVRAS